MFVTTATATTTMIIIMIVIYYINGKFVGLLLKHVYSDLPVVINSSLHKIFTVQCFNLHGVLLITKDSQLLSFVLFVPEEAHEG